MIPVLRPVFSKSERGEILSGINEILVSGWIGMGSKVKELEEKWAIFTGAKYAVATNSCTAALDIACRVAPLSNPVRVSPFTFVSSALAPLNAGYEVEFIDIDRESYCTKKSDIQVMYAGNQDGEGIIYDMAHSGGEKHNGLISCWSFHAVKNLPAGDGGMLTTNEEEIYRKAKALSWCGIDKSTWERSGKKYSWDYNIEEVGLKAHMNDITATIGLAKLRNLKDDNHYRAYLAGVYDECLPNFIKRPYKSSTWHLYTIEVEKRDELYDFLAERGIGCGVHYKPLYNYKIFGKQKRLPVTEEVSKRIISFPMHLGLKRVDIERICAIIKEFHI